MKEYKFGNPIFHKIDSMVVVIEIVTINIFIHLNMFCIYDIKLTNITNKEIINISVSNESMNLFELNKKLTLAGQRGFRFLHKNKLTIKTSSHQRYINKSYDLKFPIPMCHRQFFGVISQNRKYADNFCNDLNNPFHFACQIWIKTCM